LAATPAIVNGLTTIQLIFTGFQTSFGSLFDGNCELTTLADKIFSTDGIGLDGDGDGDCDCNGVAGDDHVFGNVATNKFFGLYGDGTGDRIINGRDFRLFRTTCGVLSSLAALNRSFDVDGNNIINGRDFRQFRARYGVPFLF
jgi:hypothetical protein